MEDYIDKLRSQWKKELPDLDTSPVEVLGRVYRISRLIVPRIEAVFEQFNIDRSEFDVLATLRRQGKPYRLTPTDLYEALFVASGSLTHRLGRLEKAGLVRRVPSEKDGRSSAAELTEKGIQIVESAYRADLKFETEIVSRLTDRDREIITTQLRNLLQNVEAFLE